MFHMSHFFLSQTAQRLTIEIVLITKSFWKLFVVNVKEHMQFNLLAFRLQLLSSYLYLCSLL